MQEAFLHYIWQYKKFAFAKMTTTDGDPICLGSVGQYNKLAGPDFFNAKLRIGGQLWAGNIEIHYSASDWYAHKHHRDVAYDSVILHVVWESNALVFRTDGSQIPTLEIAPLVAKDMLARYQQLLTRKPRWINCEQHLHAVPSLEMSLWLERLYIHRLEQRALRIRKLLKATENDWEAVLFQMLCRSFGTQINAEAFSSLSRSIPFKYLRRASSDILTAEALLFGQAGLLPHPSETPYDALLHKTYQFMSHKWQLRATGVLPVQFYGLRPSNFPTIRLSQLAMLYDQKTPLFQQLIQAPTLKAIYDILQVATSSFWETHYTFKKEHPVKLKKLTRSFMDLLVINCVIPLRFEFAAYRGNEDQTKLLDWMHKLPAEKNALVKRYNAIRQPLSDALESQAFLTLYEAYCTKHKCLQCRVGNWLLKNP